MYFFDQFERMLHGNSLSRNDFISRFQRLIFYRKKDAQGKHFLIRFIDKAQHIFYNAIMGYIVGNLYAEYPEIFGLLIRLHVPIN